MSHYTDRFTALLDACVLAGGLKRNILLSLAETGFFRPRWSDKIMEETEGAIRKITKGKADTSKQRSAMERAFPEARVENYEKIGRLIELPDPDDVHVLAAALESKSDVVVTENLKDFPAKTVKLFNIEAKSPDDFICDCIDLDEPRAMHTINTMRERLKRPEYHWESLTWKAEAQGLIRTASAMEKYKSVF